MMLFQRHAANMQRCVLLIFVLLCASCGYHLRGAIELPEEMKNIYVQNASPQLMTGFQQVLQYGSGRLANSPAEAGIIVNVLDEEMRRNTLTLSAIGKSTEYELNYYLDVELLDADGNVIMPKQSIQLRRDYFDTQINVIGKANEQTLITQEMYRQAVQSIIARARVALQAYGQ